MKKFTLFFIFFYFIFNIEGNAKADAQSNYIFTNLQSDFTDCFAYYKYSEEGVKRTNHETKDQVAKKLAEGAERSLLGAYKVGGWINMKPEAMEARAKLAVNDMSKQIDNDFVNISILIDKYADMCNDLLIDPKNRTTYWRNKYKK